VLGGTKVPRGTFKNHRFRWFCFCDNLAMRVVRDNLSRLGSVFLKQFEPISPPVAAVARNLKNLNRNSELKTAKEPVKNIGSNHINKENFHLRNRRNAVFLLLFT